MAKIETDDVILYTETSISAFEPSRPGLIMGGVNPKDWRICYISIELLIYIFSLFTNNLQAHRG